MHRRSFLKRSGLLVGLAFVSPSKAVTEIEKLYEGMEVVKGSKIARAISRYFGCKVIEINMNEYPVRPLPIPKWSAQKMVHYPAPGLLDEKDFKQYVKRYLEPAMFALRNDMIQQQRKGKRIVKTMRFHKAYDINRDEILHRIDYFIV